MPLIATSPTLVGALIKYEETPHYFNREELTCTIDNEESVGLVLYKNGSDKYVPLTETIAADFSSNPKELAILVDDRVEELAPASAGDVKLACLVKGKVLLSKAPITTSDSDPVAASKEAMYTALEALGFKFSDGLTRSTVSPL